MHADERQIDHSASIGRRCGFEELEPRQLRAGDLHLGSVYFEEATGDDSAGDRIEVTFAGGQPGTQLNRLTINGDKLLDGSVTLGDIFFDTASGGAGSFKAVPLSVVSHDGFTITGVEVQDGSSTITFHFSGFDAGEKLVFEIDVDEQGLFSSTSVAEGGEFEGSQLIGEFVNPHFEDASLTAVFFDDFDSRFDQAAAQAGTRLDLPADSYIPPASVDREDRTAGAVATAIQQPKPITIAGRVFHDPNLSNFQDAGELGISGVTLALWKLEGNAYVATGKTTVTNAIGDYKFDGILPGTYRVVETQPSGYLSVGSRPGTVDGKTVGISTAPDVISEIALLGGQDTVRNDFAEVTPSSISGRVYADPEGDCIFGENDTPLAGVEIQLLNEGGVVVQTTHTNANGLYKFAGLLPAKYAVREIQPDGYYQGGQRIGSAGGVIAEPDLTSDIPITAGTSAVDYDFCELFPAQICGTVFADPEGDGQLGANDSRLGGVTIELLDEQGTVVATTTTDANGEYCFTALPPATYTVREVQPAGYYQGGQRAGSHGGDASAADLIRHVTLGSGAQAERYDFWELIPGSISGQVHADPEGDCIIGPNDIPLAGVAIQLLDASGNVLQTTFTDAAGEYRFTNLAPGTYGVRQIQPAGYFQGDEHPGSAGGTVVSDNYIAQIVISSATDAVRYDFCELLPASLSGRVYADPEADCVFGPNDIPLTGVKVELLDEHDVIVQTVLTGSDGTYEFSGLAPGKYTVRETQPAGYYQGGTIVGTAGGVVSAPDVVREIILGSAVDAEGYDFCELLPASLSGRVYADPEADCVFGPNDTPLAGVKVELLDEHDTVVQTVFTGTDGAYEFADLAPGKYTVREIQPAGYYQGGTIVGTAGGVVAAPDVIREIILGSGTDADDYDFCETIPNSISGRVYSDPDEDCVFGPQDTPLAGVRVDLLDSDGRQIGTTITDANGQYRFDGLAPGAYTVHEHQPAGYFQGGVIVGSVGGVAAGDTISQITLVSATVATDYDFCEVPPASISGFVFQDGLNLVVQQGQTIEPTVVRDGVRDPSDTPIAGVTLLLGDESGQPVLDEAGHQRTAVTDASGFYQFVGLRSGVYTVRQIQPTGYVDSIDTAGTTGGIAVNRNQEISQQILETLSVAHNFDAIIQIPLAAGSVSAENNFSEVRIEELPPPPALPPAAPIPVVLFGVPINPQAPAIYSGAVAAPVIPLRPPAAPLAPFTPPAFITRSSGGISTWHLSVVDAGTPRGGTTGETLVDATSNVFNVATWTGPRLDETHFVLADGDDGNQTTVLFGARNAIPIAGDFNGDGRAEVGVFLDGDWFVDLNGNGLWDDEDLWAQLGNEGDKPVVGDWDGDGKDDIGIFGRAWAGDPRAIAREPGLPHSLNQPKRLAKNIPPDKEHAPLRRRELKASSEGSLRADLIDHVFNYGVTGDEAVAGDWAGNGIDCIGVFRNGVWHLDVNGDGLFTAGIDRAAQFGRQGDIPVAGDWNGDGIDELGVFRDGEWILDTNRNYQIDDEDVRLQLGGAGDRPIVGDWNGSNRDQAGVMREGRIEHQARR
jgi:protocatechuate 3,4-dioxygenase beta subunit